MANITGKKSIFFVTSPRSPLKMQDEIKLLVDKLTGRIWNTDSQTEFSKLLSSSDFFEGKILSNLDFAARDRVNRAPKALGLVDLQPVVKITDAGNLFVNGKRPKEILSRQLFKFQLPSPYHTDNENTFNIRPYLELLRLIYELDGLNKNEIAMFVMQLTNIDRYEDVRSQMLNFREKVSSIDRNFTNYRRTADEIFNNIVSKLYKEEIRQGNIETRESDENSLEHFISTKKSNFKDYADAAIRYLRATELVAIKKGTYKIFVPEEKMAEVKFILDNTERKALKFNSIVDFKAYLFEPTFPALITDNKQKLIVEILKVDRQSNRSQLERLSLEELKDAREALAAASLEKNISEQVTELKTYEKYDEILETYLDIEEDRTIEPSLIMEWNTWRAFVMLDDGDIKANLRFDDLGMPLDTAPGNRPDILCNYEDFGLTVEVTLSSGQRQYEMEGESVARHLGRQKSQAKKDTFCIFVAEFLNSATLAHFYALNRIPVSYYGGKAKIIPFSLSDFKLFLKQAYVSHTKPSSNTIKNFLTRISDSAESVEDENEWYANISSLVNSWV
ncbi:MAG: hypothetical protein A2186_01055 [Candidatus Levybacteria bacterium RIFOXYA1_FULL_41_10]|nr:MAG: Restriction endonuclease, type II, AlwI [Candidatus Levybacteria bacterium GW2011_GWA1_39_32]OGH20984.1 MAG: hypothetical protein A2695_01130 [Candidatus Levybacteria bacterium RIFCSPHIGHO2_01_FULL_40_83]OGH27054.1 MAG: hypothetical protein A3D82_02375 [Candidatus Levybacteria bacterium RIFCSPHIGHO2_02_FULL_40_29]OGH32946.1 MAG: hypothetical protein A3E70_02195 [Candidatus Levybacteria bacterium RIFCSPHIGHO2_12_FULL_40_44]OGH50725.1 MAG: hypothetical protein A3J18_01005 [Candidatus Levy